MAGPTLNTDGVVLLKRPPAENFQTFTVFSPAHGALTVLQRVSKKSIGSTLSLDLFDEAAFILESTNQGQTWFVKEARLITRHADIGRNYQSLQLASALSLLVSRNPVSEDGRPGVHGLLQQALAAFATATRPDIVYFKSLYRFARDEGYPVKQEWFPTLPAADRETVAGLLNQSLSAQTASSEEVARLLRRLESYLRASTEILLD